MTQLLVLLLLLTTKILFPSASAGAESQGEGSSSGPPAWKGAPSWAASTPVHASPQAVELERSLQPRAERPPPLVQLRAAAGRGKGNGAGPSALCPSPGWGKEAVTSATENESSWPKRRKNRGEKSLVSKLKRKTLGQVFLLLVFCCMTYIKLKTIGKPLSRAAKGREVAATAAHSSSVCPALTAPVPRIRDGDSRRGCKAGTAPCADLVRQLIRRAAKHLLLHCVFTEKGLFQNEDFLRKIVPFQILFVPNFVDLDLGFGTAFFSHLKSENWRKKHGNRVNKNNNLWKSLGKTPQKIHLKVPSCAEIHFSSFPNEEEQSGAHGRSRSRGPAFAPGWEPQPRREARDLSEPHQPLARPLVARGEPCWCRSWRRGPPVPQSDMNWRVTVTENGKEWPRKCSYKRKAN